MHSYGPGRWVRIEAAKYTAGPEAAARSAAGAGAGAGVGAAADDGVILL